MDKSDEKYYNDLQDMFMTALAWAFELGRVDRRSRHEWYFAG